MTRELSLEGERAFAQIHADVMNEMDPNGPQVDYRAVGGFLADELDEADSENIANLISRYANWFDAYWSLKGLPIKSEFDEDFDRLLEIAFDKGDLQSSPATADATTRHQPRLRQTVQWFASVGIAASILFLISSFSTTGEPTSDYEVVAMAKVSDAPRGAVGDPNAHYASIDRPFDQGFVYFIVRAETGVFQLADVEFIEDQDRITSGPYENDIRQMVILATEWDGESTVRELLRSMKGVDANVAAKSLGKSLGQLRQGRVAVSSIN